MRSGACTLQQTLTTEAASVLKHSLGLARRRGHAQVTPLHVAATLLSLRGISNSFRRACLKSTHSHSQFPLQCRALELCFNVALNRLPTTPQGPNFLHSTTLQPSLSNALIAALKRAQAHQRRGCIEQQQQQQQQPLLTIKVELEQLVISILDDPSVSRVMREAGFSSTAIKNNIEDSSFAPSSVFQCYNTSGGVFSSPCSPSTSENTSNFRKNHFLAEYNNSALFSPQKKAPAVYPVIDDSASSSKEEIKVVLDILLRKKKKNIVIVGDSVSLTEGLVGELIGRVERGEVPDELKSTHFIKFFQFTSAALRFMKRDEVEKNLSELKRKVDAVIASEGRGGIFYIGDLKWTVEEACLSEKEEGSFDGEVSGYYNPVGHVVAEIGKLISDCGRSSNANKVWLMATASYQTYMRCQMRKPPLEIQWALQAVPVPSAGLGLTLHASSVLDSKMTIPQNTSYMLEETKLFSNKEQQDELNCCEECASNYEKEAQFFIPGQKKLLPFWLQSHSTETYQKDELTQLKRKWNRLCHCLHQSKKPQNHWGNSLYSNYSSNAKIYPYDSSNSCMPNKVNIFPDSSSISFVDSAAKPLIPRFRRQQSCTIDFHAPLTSTTESIILDSLEGMEESKEENITLALGNSSFGGGSGENSVENVNDRTLRRAHVVKLLQENVPWQSETLPSIAEALIGSKSAKQGKITWLLMDGNDSIGKRRLAHAIAESVFGSADTLLHLDFQKKETLAAPFPELLARALKTQEKLVVLIENVDFADAQFLKFLKDGFEKGKFGTLGRTQENAGQAVFLLTKNGSTMTSNEEKNQESVIKLSLQVSETKPNLEAPCFGQKLKADLDLFSMIKKPRIEEKGEAPPKDFSRQSSFNTLDLNMKAEDEDETGENIPITSELTGETIVDPLKSNGFLDSIENRFEFNRSPARDREMIELFLNKIKGSFEVVCGKQYLVNFTVEERALEALRGVCGCFTDSLFEKWLKDIFQSSLQTVNIGGKESIVFNGEKGIVFNLCWGGKGDRKLDIGFMGSPLPKDIQVNNFMG